jgi:hypothetical protein
MDGTRPFARGATEARSRTNAGRVAVLRAVFDNSASHMGRASEMADPLHAAQGTRPRDRQGVTTLPSRQGSRLHARLYDTARKRRQQTVTRCKN